LGEIYEKTTLEIERLAHTYALVNASIQDPKKIISASLIHLKQNLTMRKEKFILMCDQMIDELDVYENECLENIELNELASRNKDFLDEIQANLAEWNDNNKHALMVSSDLERNEIRKQAQELNKKLDAKYKEIKSDILMNKLWVYQENEKVDFELQKELMKFGE